MSKASPIGQQTSARTSRSRNRGREFLRRVIILVVAVALLGLLFVEGVRYLGSFVPRSAERLMAMNYLQELPAPTPATVELNKFTERMATAQGLPPEVAINVHIIEQDWVQSFATLGGHILVYRGLLQQLKSEDELAAVIAHELAHVANRHPSQALGRRVNVGLFTALISQDMAESIARPSFRDGLKTAPHFNSDHELTANQFTGAALSALYGHVGGAVDLNRTLRRLIAAGGASPPGMIATHDGVERGEELIRRLAQENGWPLDEPSGKRRALPAWLGQQAGAQPVAPPPAATGATK